MHSVESRLIVPNMLLASEDIKQKQNERGRKATLDLNCKMDVMVSPVLLCWTAT